MLVQWWSWYFCLQKPRCQLWFLEPFEQGVLLPLCLLHREETSTLLWQIHLKSPALFLKLQASFFYSTGFARYSLGVNVFSTKVLIGDTIFTFPTRDRTAILRGHPSHTREGLAACRRGGWVLVRPRESNPRPPTRQSDALPTELTLPRVIFNNYFLFVCFLFARSVLT